LHFGSSSATQAETSNQTFEPSPFSRCVVEVTPDPEFSNGAINQSVIRSESLPAESIGSSSREVDANSIDNSTNSSGGSHDASEYQECGKWEARFNELLEYRARFGHCNVPYHFKEKQFLYSWVKRQRHQYKLLHQGKGSHLTPERIRSLESVGFSWDSHAMAWEMNYEVLQKFVQQEGHCHIPARETRLFAWAKRQRRQHRRWLAKQDSTMNEDRCRRLTILGFKWGSPQPKQAKKS